MTVDLCMNNPQSVLRSKGGNDRNRDPVEIEGQRAN